MNSSLASSSSISSVIGSILIISVVSLLGYVFFFGGLIWAIKTRNNTSNPVTEKIFSLKLYLLTVRMIALVILTIAIVSIFKAGLGAVFNADISYTESEICASLQNLSNSKDNSPSKVDINQYCSYSSIDPYTSSSSSYPSSSSSTGTYGSTSNPAVDVTTNEYKVHKNLFLNSNSSILIRRDLVIGITELLVSFPLFLVHTLIQRRFHVDSDFDILDKVFVVSIALIYGLIAVSTLSGGIYTLLEKLLINSNSYNSQPGILIAIAIATLPIWVYYAYRLILLTRYSIFGTYKWNQMNSNSKVTTTSTIPSEVVKTTEVSETTKI